MKVTCNICGVENNKTSLKCKSCGARLPIMPEEVIVPGTNETVNEVRENQEYKRVNYDKKRNTINTKNSNIGLIIIAFVLFGISPIIGIIFILLAFKRNDKSAKRVGIAILFGFISFMIILGIIFYNAISTIVETQRSDYVLNGDEIVSYLDAYYDDYTFEEEYSDDNIVRYKVTVDDIIFDAALDKICLKNDCLMPYYDNYDLYYRASVLDNYFSGLGYNFEVKVTNNYYTFDDMPDSQMYYLNIVDASNDKIANDLANFHGIYKTDIKFDSFIDIIICKDICKSITYNKYVSYSKDYYLNRLNTLFGDNTDLDIGTEI